MENLNADTMPTYLTLFIMALTANSLGIQIATLFVVGSSICYMVQIYFRQCYQSWEKETDNKNILELANVGERFFHLLSWIFGLIAFFLISANVINIYVASVLIMLPIVMFWFLWVPRSKADFAHLYQKLKWFFENHKPG